MSLSVYSGHEGKHTEGEVQGLGREVPDDVRRVATPERERALVAVRAGKAVADAFVRRGETALLDLYQGPS